MLTPNKGSQFHVSSQIPDCCFHLAIIPPEDCTEQQKSKTPEKSESGILETHWFPDPPNNTPPGKIPAQVAMLSKEVAQWYKEHPSKGNKERKCSTPTCETLITPGATSGYCRSCFAKYKRKRREAAKINSKFTTYP